MDNLTDLIERTAAQFSLLNISVTFRGAENSPGYLWGASAQWNSNGAGNIDGRGVTSASGADPVSAILSLIRIVAIKQDGPLPVAVELQAAA